MYVADQSKQTANTCAQCGKVGHSKAVCWFNPKNKAKRPKWYTDRDEAKVPSKSGNVTFSAKQFNYLVGQLKSQNSNKPNKKKRKAQAAASSDDEEAHVMLKKLTNVEHNDTSDSDSDYSKSTKSSYVINHRSKRQKKSHKATEVVGEITNKEGDLVPIKQV